MGEAMVMVRFLKRCFIGDGGGRTVDPGEVAPIPESHVNPDLHERLEPAAPAPEVTGAPEGSPEVPPASAPAEPAPDAAPDSPAT